MEPDEPHAEPADPEPPATGRELRLLARVWEAQVKSGAPVTIAEAYTKALKDEDDRLKKRASVSLLRARARYLQLLQAEDHHRDRAAHDAAKLELDRARLEIDKQRLELELAKAKASGLLDDDGAEGFNIFLPGWAGNGEPVDADREAPPEQDIDVAALDRERQRDEASGASGAPDQLSDAAPAVPEP